MLSAALLLFANTLLFSLRLAGNGSFITDAIRGSRVHSIPSMKKNPA